MRQYNKPKRSQVSVFVDEDNYRKIKTFSEKEGRSISNFAGLILINKIEQLEAESS
jgi:hypothetical protein